MKFVPQRSTIFPISAIAWRDDPRSCLRMLGAVDTCADRLDGRDVD